MDEAASCSKRKENPAAHLHTSNRRLVLDLLRTLVGGEIVKGLRPVAMGFGDSSYGFDVIRCEDELIESSMEWVGRRGPG